MDLYLAEIYDYFGECPMAVGVYDSMEKAYDAIAVVIGAVKQKEGDIPEERFVETITPIKLNGFCPAVMDWFGYE